MGQRSSKSSQNMDSIKPVQTPHNYNPSAVPHLSIPTLDTRLDANDDQSRSVPRQNDSEPEALVAIRRGSDAHSANQSLYRIASSTIAETDQSPVSCGHSLNKRFEIPFSGYTDPTPTTSKSDASSKSIAEKPVFEKKFIQDKPALKIHCPLLIDTLKRAVTNSPHLARNEDPHSMVTTLYEPYEFIIHNRKRILRMDSGQPGKTSLHHAQLLLDFVRNENSYAWEKSDEIQSRKCYKIAFKYLWLIYPPGATVFRNDNGVWRAYKVERLEGNSYSNIDTKTIHCYYLDFDKTGRFLVPYSEEFVVSSYSSETLIGTLELIPEWSFHHHDTLLHHTLLQGRKYWAYNGSVQYRDYHGDEWLKLPRDDSLKVVVDYVTTSKHNSSTNVTARSISSSSCPVCLGEAIGLYSYPKGAPHDPDVCSRGQGVPGKNEIVAGDEDNQLLFCPPRVWAFSLRHKTWKLALLKYLTKVQRNNKPSEALWMDSDKAKLLESMLSAYVENGNDNTSVDTIKGKGRSLNILLHGNSGTGKTFTVECLSEKRAVPLYMTSCADLGTEPDIAEQRLHEALLRGVNWGAIVLLDDADLFIHRRDVHDMKRNALVTIFLHHLEYSEGIHFITSNKTCVFDLALMSRTHLIVQLPDFSFEAQQWIWRQFIVGIDVQHSVDRAELESFINNDLKSLDNGSHAKMNGRQIRNCLDASLALARTRQSALKLSDVKRMLTLGKEYMEILEQSPNATMHSKMGAMNLIPKPNRR